MIYISNYTELLILNEGKFLTWIILLLALSCDCRLARLLAGITVICWPCAPDRVICWVAFWLACCWEEAEFASMVCTVTLGVGTVFVLHVLTTPDCPAPLVLGTLLEGASWWAMEEIWTCWIWPDGVRIWAIWGWFELGIWTWCIGWNMDIGNYNTGFSRVALFISDVG